jgi:IS66 C-terminal element
MNPFDVSEGKHRVIVQRNAATFPILRRPRIQPGNTPTEVHALPLQVQDFAATEEHRFRVGSDSRPDRCGAHEGGALLAVVGSNTPAVKRMPRVVNYKFSPDMGQNDCVMAVGRKAFLFVGSERAGHAAAIYYSLVESCKANKVNPLTYLTYVLGNARNKSITLPTPDEFTASNIAHVG